MCDVGSQHITVHGNVDARQNRTSRFERVSEGSLLNVNCNDNNKRVKYPKGAGLLRFPSVCVLQAQSIHMPSLAHSCDIGSQYTPVHGSLMRMTTGTSRVEKFTRSLLDCYINERKLSAEPQGA
jgi:hypothetical protein